MTTSTVKRQHSASSHTPASTDVINRMPTPPSPAPSTVSKADSEEDESLSWTNVNTNYINPFVHRINIENNVDLAKVSFVNDSEFIPMKNIWYFAAFLVSIVCINNLFMCTTEGQMFFFSYLLKKKKIIFC